MTHISCQPPCLQMEVRLGYSASLTLSFMVAGNETAMDTGSSLCIVRYTVLGLLATARQR
jgi:hypothetical protein